MVAIPVKDLRARELARHELVEARLRDEILGRDVVTFAPVHAIALAPSKRVRSALVLASARAVGVPDRTAIELAVVVELVHTFSLVHDDLEDNATTRRGHPAVHVAEGNAIAINTGDALHALAWSALLSIDAPAPQALELARLFGSTLDRMVAGQARDLVWTRDRRTDLTIDDYCEMVRGKTGALMGFAVAGPAMLAEHPATAKLHQAGEQLGIAFQILDDVASVLGDTTVLGKPVGPSANGVGSAPALLAGPADDGTTAAIALARRYWSHACGQIEAAELVDDRELGAVMQAVLAQLMEACGLPGHGDLTG